MRKRADGSSIVLFYARLCEADRRLKTIWMAWVVGRIFASGAFPEQAKATSPDLDHPDANSTGRANERRAAAKRPANADREQCSATKRRAFWPSLSHVSGSFRRR